MGWLQRSLVGAVLLASLIAGCGNNNSKTDDVVKVGNQVTLPPIPFDAGTDPLVSAAGQDLYVLQGPHADISSKVPLRAAFYDSTKNRWKALPPLPEVLLNPFAHWTGKEFLVAGFSCSAPKSDEEIGRWSKCPRVVPTMALYNPERGKWSNKSLMPSIFPGEQDIEAHDTMFSTIFGSYQDKTYLIVSGKRIVLVGDSVVSTFPKGTYLFDSANCQVGSVVVNIGIPENLYDVDDFINNRSPDGRLPRFHQLAMEILDLADKDLSIQKIAMPDKKLLNTEIQDFENSRMKAVCTSSKVLLIAPNSGPLFSWDPDTKEWSAVSQQTSSVSTSTSFPLQELNFPILSGERMLVPTYGPDGQASYTEYGSVNDQYKSLVLPLKIVDGKIPKRPNLILPYQGTFIMYQDLPGSPNGEFTILP
ncbi:MAG: hypothetical protein ACSLFB_06215 [Acidimicrobiales bacterium]